MAKYIVQQYIAAAGGKAALNSIYSMYAMGKVQMMASEFCNHTNNSKISNKKGMKYIGGEMGGFVLWQKKPDLWCIELMVSGSKLSAGSDGKVAWRQTPWQQSHASRGPPRPLRRALQVQTHESICIAKNSKNNHMFQEMLNVFLHWVSFGFNILKVNPSETLPMILII